MNRQGRQLQAIGGHLVDLYRIARFEIANPHSYTKVRQIKALARRTGSRLLIEAGTYLGNTAMRCSGFFERVVTIELDDELHRRARRYLAGRRNVQCLHGDALRLLPSILESADVQAALIFLDGHYSGGDTARGDFTEPACEEIAMLAGHRHKISGLVIDDFRCFGRDPGWPRRSVLLKAVEDSFGEEFDYTIHLDQVLVWRHAMQGSGQVGAGRSPRSSQDAGAVSRRRASIASRTRATGMLRTPEDS